MKLKRHPTTQQLTLDWADNPLTDDVAAYNIYKLTSGVWLKIATVQKSEWPIPKEVIGKTLRVTAVNAQGVESGPSDQIIV